MHRFQQITLHPSSAHTGKYNEIKSSTEDMPAFTEEEVERAIKRTKRYTTHGMDEISNDIIKLGGGVRGEEGGQIVLVYITNIFNNMLKKKQIADSWHEAKIVILFKKGDPKDIKNYRPISLLSHSFTRLLETRIKEFWMKTSQKSKQDSEKAFLHQIISKL